MAEVVVVGAGLAGSAAAWRLVQRGHTVTVLEQFSRHHDRGSSHGGERIFRLGYNDPTYARLAVEAGAGWGELEAATGRTIIHEVGMVDHGSEDEAGRVTGEVDRVEAACAAAGVATERVSERQASKRWPGMRFAEPILFQADGGHIDAAIALESFWDIAPPTFDSPVRTVEPTAGGGVSVWLAAGPLRRQADAVVVAPGAWAPKLLDGLVAHPPITTTLETVAFFRPRRDGAWPCFIHHAPGVYGLPTPDGLIKIGGHGIGPVIDPDDRPEGTPPGMVKLLVDYAREWLPGLDPAPVDVKTCLYATTPTDDFVITRVGLVVALCGLGGHGFKFGPALGTRAAELVDDALAER